MLLLNSAKFQCAHGPLKTVSLTPKVRGPLVGNNWLNGALRVRSDRPGGRQKQYEKSTNHAATTRHERKPFIIILLN